VAQHQIHTSQRLTEVTFCHTQTGFESSFESNVLTIPQSDAEWGGM